MDRVGAKPNFDSYWTFHRDQFLELVPAPGTLTVDVGCGEGRFSRHLKELGHKMTSFDPSRTMIEHAKESDPNGRYEIAQAHAMPLDNASADLAVAFMSLHDVDQLQSSIDEIARVLGERGKLCMAIVHPLNSAGSFRGPSSTGEYVIEGSYLESFRYSMPMEREGMEMTFNSMHHSIDRYSRCLEEAGFLIQALREHPVPAKVIIESGRYIGWSRLPLFLHIKAVKLTHL